MDSLYMLGDDVSLTLIMGQATDAVAATAAVMDDDNDDMIRISL